MERLATFRQYTRKPAPASVSSVGAERFTKLNLTSDQGNDITPYTRLIKH